MSRGRTTMRQEESLYGEWIREMLSGNWRKPGSSPYKSSRGTRFSHTFRIPRLTHTHTHTQIPFPWIPTYCQWCQSRCCSWSIFSSSFRSPSVRGVAGRQAGRRAGREGGRGAREREKNDEWEDVHHENTSVNEIMCWWHQSVRASSRQPARINWLDHRYTLALWTPWDTVVPFFFLPPPPNRHHHHHRTYRGNPCTSRQWIHPFISVVFTASFGTRPFLMHLFQYWRYSFLHYNGVKPNQVRAKQNTGFSHPDKI